MSTAVTESGRKPSHTMTMVRLEAGTGGVTGATGGAGVTAGGVVATGVDDGTKPLYPDPPPPHAESKAAVTEVTTQKAFDFMLFRKGVYYERLFI